MSASAAARRRLALAIGVSALLILAAPFIGQLRNELLSRLESRFVPVMGAVVGTAIVLAVLTAAARIRARRAFRFGAIAAALAIGIGYAMVSRTGRAEVDAVERFHFLQYGLITLLFYRAFRRVDDASALVLPVLAALVVATLEEWLQWFIPARIGEMRDVFLNLWAILCGLLFSIGLDPPERIAVPLTAESSSRIRRYAALFLLIFAAFFHSVHLGYRIEDAEIGTFKSRYSPTVLRETTLERERRWRQAPPLTWSRLSREDQYLSEGIAHVQRRNQRWEENDIRAAWFENLILERYYAPVLDTQTYIAAPHRWSPGHRAEAAARLPAGAGAPYESDAEPSPIYTWPKLWFWAALAVIVVALLLPRRRLRPAASRLSL
jgi:hypothetical protein